MIPIRDQARQDDAFDRIVALLKDVRPTSKGVRARCPAHDDHTPSLDVDRGDDGKVLIACRSARCSTESVMKALTLPMSALFPTRPDSGWAQEPKSNGKGKEPKRHTTKESLERAAIWVASGGGKKKGGKATRDDYMDRDGNVVGGVFRVDFPDGTKDIRRFRRDGQCWLLKDMPAPRPLFRLPELLNADHEAPVLFVEGEKCVRAIHELGLVGTTSAGGAHQPIDKTDFSPLTGRSVVILPDNDQPGRSYADRVAAMAYQVGASVVYRLELPGLGDGGDVYDWAEAKRKAGSTNEQIAADLREILTSATLVPEVAAAPDGDANPADRGSGGRFRLGEPDPSSGKLILSDKKTLPTAKAFLRAFHTIDGQCTLLDYGGVIWQWRDNRYVAVEESRLRNQLHPWLHDALRVHLNRQTGELELVDFESNPRTVAAALQTIRAEVYLSATTTVPSWLQGAEAREPVEELLPCKTMTLHIPTGKALPATPSLFNFSAIDFDYDAKAAQPVRWLKFLDELFEDDLESTNLLQEWFGYCLTADTRQQKMLLIVGPRRSGKGTIARVLKELVGSANVTGPTTSGLASNFGLQPLLGRTLAIISDARFSGDHMPTLVERLLCISGEDAITVDRKFLTSVTMKLPVRFVCLTNELPRFNDASAALASRFMVLNLTKSFLGNEDIDLTKDLLAELPGILLWALEGWHRLQDRRRFQEPQSSRAAVQEIEDLSSPVGAFVRERCVVRPGLRVAVETLYGEWKAWCESDGRTTCTTKQVFGRDLAAAAAGITSRRGTGMVRFYDGIGLATGGTQ